MYIYIYQCPDVSEDPYITYISTCVYIYTHACVDIPLDPVYSHEHRLFHTKKPLYSHDIPMELGFRDGDRFQDPVTRHV